MTPIVGMQYVLQNCVQVTGEPMPEWNGIVVRVLRPPRLRSDRRPTVRLRSDVGRPDGWSTNEFDWTINEGDDWATYLRPRYPDHPDLDLSDSSAVLDYLLNN